MEARVSDQPAFILRRRDWANSSLLLDLFSRDYGCIRVMARGARRSPAKAPHRPFELLSVGWSGRQELKTLTSIEAIALPIDERNFLALLYVNELIGAMLPPAEANTDVFAGYLALLQAARLEIGEAELRGFEFRLMQALGYFPDIDSDAHSGMPIQADGHYQFVINSGFVACAESARDSVSGRTVIDWARGEYRQDAVLRLAKSVLRSTIDFNLHGKTLKSRDVTLEMMRRR
jgi:DNA repair protein RecO (recombination protein O)